MNLLALLVTPHPTVAQWFFIISIIFCAITAVFGLLARSWVVMLTAAAIAFIALGLLF